MNATQTKNAIIARLQGEWDNPDLLKLGPLGHTFDDIKRIIELYEESDVK